MGYRRINLHYKGKHYCYSVHRIVLMTFNPVKNMEMLQVDHIDFNRANNKLENLRWVNAQENTDHRIKFGVHLTGEKVHNAKLTEKKVLDILKFYFSIKQQMNMPIAKTAKKFCVSREQVKNVVYGNNWKTVFNKFQADWLETKMKEQGEGE